MLCLCDLRTLIKLSVFLYYVLYYVCVLFVQEYVPESGGGEGLGEGLSALSGGGLTLNDSIVYIFLNDHG